MTGGELCVLDGPGRGVVVQVSRPTVLGRGEDADVSFNDAEMSARHLRVSVQAGDVVIEDLGSTNGTLVNGKRLVGSHRARPGDVIKIGATVLQFRASDATRIAQTHRRPSSRHSHFELRVRSGPNAGAVVALSRAVVMGRDPECDLVLADEVASRHHAQITEADGQVLLEDLRSTNGTYLNGERLLTPRQLNAGDHIEIANASIEVVDPAAKVHAPRVAVPQLTGVRDVFAQPARLSADQPGSRKWWTLLCVCVAVFMLLLDTTIVAVALPSISKSLHASFSELQWVLDAYALLLAVFLLTAGSVADIFGRREVFLGGLVIFTVTSAICGAVTSATALDIARGVQGIGGAMMFATSLALLAQEFPPKERGVAFGIWGAAAGAATALGPLAGGALTQAFGWQSIFLVNVPIGLVLLYATLRKLVNVAGERTPIDWPGLLTFSLGLFAIVLAVIRGNDEGWTSTLILSLLVGGALMLVAFVVVELRTTHPMLDLSLYRIPTFNGASIVGFTLNGSYIALILYITLWLSSILDFPPFQTGLRLLPLFAVTLIVAPACGRLSTKLPHNAMLAVGMLAIAGGLVLMSSVGTNSAWTVLLPGELLCGLGAGIVNAPLSTAAIAVVPAWKSGMASGINGTFRQVGMAAGIAAYGAVFQHAVVTHLSKQLAATPLAHQAVQYGNSIAAGGTPALLARTPKADRSSLKHAAAVSFSSGLSEILLLGGAVALAGAIAGLVLVRARDAFARPQAPAPAVPASSELPLAPAGKQTT